MSEDEHHFLLITEDSHLKIVKLQKNSKVLITEMNDSKYIYARWLKECAAIIAFTNQQVFYFFNFLNSSDKRLNF